MDKAEKVKLLEKEFDNVCAVKEVEEWVINPSTHFNDWASFSSDDFSPIVDAFKCFFDSFKCPDCGSIIKLTKQKNKDTSLCCKCKKINLNLECKEKSDKLPVADINT